MPLPPIQSLGWGREAEGWASLHFDEGHTPTPLMERCQPRILEGGDWVLLGVKPSLWEEAGCSWGWSQSLRKEPGCSWGGFWRL